MGTLLAILLSLISLLAYVSWRMTKSPRLPVAAVSPETVIVEEKNVLYEDIEPLHDFDLETTSPIRSYAFKPRYHLTMGLENIPFSELIEMDTTYLERLQLRRSVMDNNPDATVRCNPAAATAAFELYTWMTESYLPKRFPTIYKPQPDRQTLLNTATSESIPLNPPSALAALHTLSDHVDTDFLILLPSSTASDGSPIYHLEAFTTCFPNGFNTAAKLGLPLAEIHAPVPGYKAKLEKSMDRFFARLEVGRVVKRVNWAVTTDDVLFKEGGTHLYADVAGEGVEEALERLREGVVVGNCRLRSERQVLFRLPGTKALVFAFKTYMYRLEDVKAAGDGPALAEAIEGLAKGSVPEVNFYKRGVVWSEKVLAYLRS